MRTIRIVLSFIPLIISFLHSEIAPPFSFTLTQPDGYEFEARMRGSEYYNYMHTEDDYTISSKDEDGELWWYYADKKNGKITPSNLRVTSDISPPSFSYLIRPDFEKQEQLDNIGSHYHDHHPQRSTAINPLIILIDFNDGGLPVPSHSYTREQFSSLFFDENLDPEDHDLPGSYQMSVVDYYNEVSGGEISISGGISSVSDWVTLPESYSHYVDGNQGFGGGDGGILRSAKSALVDALERINVDMTQFDANSDGVCDVVILVMEGWASGSSDQFWSFKGTLKEGEAQSIDPSAGSYDDENELTYDNIKIRNYVVTTEQIHFSDSNHSQYQQGDIRPIGTFAHELGHILGLPDLYDTSDISAPGIGHWGLMGSGNWNNQVSPASFSAWSAGKLGIVDLIELDNLSRDELLIQPVHSSRVAYKINLGSETLGEYFLFENRAAYGTDQYLVEEGLMLWHIDDRITATYPSYNSVNTNSDFYGVRLIEASGGSDLTESDGDEASGGQVFTGEGSVSLSDYSSPSLVGYSYDRDADGQRESSILSQVSVSSISKVGDDIQVVISSPEVYGQRFVNNPNGVDGFLGSYVANPGVKYRANRDEYLKVVQPTVVLGPSISYTGITVNIYDLSSTPNAGENNLITSFDRNISWLSSEGRDYGQFDIYTDGVYMQSGINYFIELIYEGEGAIYTPSSIGFHAPMELSGKSYWVCTDISSQTCEKDVLYPSGKGDFAVSIVTSTNENAELDDVYVPASYSFPYPNPTSDNIHIDIDGVIGNLSIYMYDVLGKEVLSFDASITAQERLFIPTVNLSSGIYFIVVKHEKNTIKKYKTSIIK